MTKDFAAPDTILKTIFCNCAAGCVVRYGCRKADIRCTSVCGNCEGTCPNVPSPKDEDLDEDTSEQPNF